MGSKTVLIIDDDLDILETTGALLEYEGFVIHSAETVEAGIEMIESIQPDIILLDIMFPEKKTKGFDAAEMIKEKYPNLPILAFSTINRDYALDIARDELKVEEFINKPVPTDKLVELVNKYT